MNLFMTVNYNFYFDNLLDKSKEYFKNFTNLLMTVNYDFYFDNLLVKSKEYFKFYTNLFVTVNYHFHFLEFILSLIENHFFILFTIKLSLLFQIHQEVYFREIVFY